MTDTIPAMHPDRWRRVFITVLIFGLAGPPIGVAVLTSGAIVTVLLMSHGPQFDPLGLVRNFPEFVRFLLLAIPFSYIVGGIQAFATGLMIAAYGMGMGKPGYLVAAIAGLVTFAGFVLLGPHRDVWEYGMMSFVHVVPALVCWHIAKRFWVEPV